VLFVLYFFVVFVVNRINYLTPPPPHSKLPFIEIAGLIFYYSGHFVLLNGNEIPCLYSCCVPRGIYRTAIAGQTAIQELRGEKIMCENNTLQQAKSL
jgi:hypothetical protein